MAFFSTNDDFWPCFGRKWPKIQFKKKLYNFPRQKLSKAYWQNAYLDIVKYDTIKKKKSMSGKRVMPFILPSNSIFDIDDKFSFKMVEEIFKKNYK